VGVARADARFASGTALLVTLVGGPIGASSTYPVQVGAWIDGMTIAVAINGDIVYYNRGTHLVVTDLANPYPDSCDRRHGSTARDLLESEI
jgi:hypothetical protein